MSEKAPMAGEELELALAARITQKRQQVDGIKQRQAEIGKMTDTVARLDAEMASIRAAIAAGEPWPAPGAVAQTNPTGAVAATMQG